MRSATFLSLCAWGASASSTCENDADSSSLLQAKRVVRVHKQTSANDLVKSLRHVASSFTTDSAVTMSPEDVNAALGTADAALQTMFPMFAEQHNMAEQELEHALGAVQACHNEQPRVQLERAVVREAAARDECEAALDAAIEAEHEACEGQGDDPNCLCNEARTAITDQTGLCVVVSQTYATVFCENHASCNMLEQCYAQEVEVYNRLRDDVEAMMQMRQQEYRAAMQSQCLIGLITTAMLSGTPIDHAVLVACDDVDVSSLTINFPEVPPAPAECPALQSDDPDCAEPEPITNIPQCLSGGYLTGDGTGGHETHIGTADSPEQCAVMVQEQCPDANGATLPTSGSGNCYCEFGMTGVNGNTHWQSCSFVVPPAVPQPSASFSQCAGGGYLTGDGTGGRETHIGTADSPEQCIAMVHAECPEANGATLPTSGSGRCYCEFGMTGVNGNTNWQSCSFMGSVPEPAQCVGGGYVTGDGTGGHERHIGTAASPEECAAMVRASCPDANGATLPTSGSGRCYCEFGMTGVNNSPSWQSCSFA